MVGGWIISIENTEPGIWQIWACDRRGDECAVRVRERPIYAIGDEIWWQGGKIIGNAGEMEKYGNSYDPREGQP